jgi:hypothetical protein
MKKKKPRQTKGGFMKILNLKLSKVARNMDLQLWMWSAGVLGLGIGAYFAGFIGGYVFWILLVGVVAHGWSMYKVYLKK